MPARPPAEKEGRCDTSTADLVAVSIWDEWLGAVSDGVV